MRPGTEPAPWDGPAGVYRAAVRVVCSSAHLLHDPTVEVASGRVIPAWEVTGRAEAIREALAADPAFELQAPAEHGLDPVLAVHDAGLIRFLERAWAEWRAGGGPPEGMIPDTFPNPAMRRGAGSASEPRAIAGRLGYWCFDTSTPITAGTWTAARAAVDVAITATEAVLAGEPAAYGLCRPPGHHVGRRCFGGYCVLNNAAIAAHRLTARGAGRVGILDVDFHHGNGTQELFWERGDVAYASIHGDPDRVYPYFSGFADETGGGEGAGATFNQPMAAGTEDAAFLVAVDRALDWLGGRTDGLLVVSLGIDTYGLDPICDFALTTPAYHETGRRVAATGRRIVVLQEGGYYVPHLGENVRQWLRGVAGLPLDLAPRRIDGPTVQR
jgi:acetoin utilization deacetylase AcuC-like enzyme